MRGSSSTTRSSRSASRASRRSSSCWSRSSGSSGSEVDATTPTRFCATAYQRCSAATRRPGPNRRGDRFACGRARARQGGRSPASHAAERGRAGVPMEHERDPGHQPGLDTRVPRALPPVPARARDPGGSPGSANDRSRANKRRSWRARCCSGSGRGPQRRRLASANGTRHRRLATVAGLRAGGSRGGVGERRPRASR